jgi:hypothetical protein
MKKLLAALVPVLMLGPVYAASAAAGDTTITDDTGTRPVAGATTSDSTVTFKVAGTNSNTQRVWFWLNKPFSDPPDRKDGDAPFTWSTTLTVEGSNTLRVERRKANGDDVRATYNFTFSPLPECQGVDVVAPASIQNAINSNQTGTTFCLSGTFNIGNPLVPKDGQSFVGPAEIVGVNANDTAFLIRDAGASSGALNVTVDDLDIHGFTLRAVACWLGTTVRNSEIHHNNRNGLGCGLNGGAGVLIENNHIYSNGSTDELGAGGGGMKFANGDGVTVRDNLIEANIGNGIWCDLDCGTFTVTGNTVLGSTRKGIFFEISFGPALIEDNTVRFNNCSPSYWGDGNPECSLPSGDFGPQSAGSPGGGIAANSSMHVTIRNNILGDNEVAGINFRDDGRQYDAPFNILAEFNTLNGDLVRNCDIAGITCRNNT